MASTMLKAALLGLLASARALPTGATLATPFSTRDVTHLVGHPPNDFSCKSEHNPIVMIHAFSANEYVDLNTLQYYLNSLGYCTFTFTYGAHKLFPLVGGLTEMLDSAKVIASFIEEVHTKTGADKLDLIGHSEGGVQGLLVPLTQSGIASKLEHTIHLGPAVHGAQYFGLTQLAYLGGDLTAEMVKIAVDTLGAPAAPDMATGGSVYKTFLAANGHIVQSGVKASIIMSRKDTLVAPDVSIVNEAGVRNLYVQDYCPDDAVGHAGLAWDTSVWGIIVNELREDYNNKTVACEKGLPV